MDALKKFVSASRKPVSHDVSIGHRPEIVNSSGPSDIPVLTDEALCMPGRPTSGSRTIPEATSLRDLITTRSMFPLSVVLPDYDLQVIFQYLREFGQPCTLFGESDSDRLRRCIDCTEHLPFKKVRSLCSDPLSSSRVDQKCGRKGEYSSADFGVESIRLIKDWIEKHMETWRVEFDESGKSSNSRQVALYQNTRDDIDNYFRKWISEGFNHHMLPLLSSISKAVETGDFKLANEKYMELSIGNAAWPIGVGNWAIQERAADDKIGTTGHALNDEVTRKFIQAIKRLITRAER